MALWMRLLGICEVFISLNNFIWQRRVFTGQRSKTYLKLSVLEIIRKKFNMKGGKLHFNVSGLHQKMKLRTK